MISVASNSEDFRQLDRLIEEYEEELPLDLRHADAGAVRAELRERFTEPNVAFIARLEGNACGCVFLSRIDAKTAIVTKLYVRPDCRGKGLSRALMEALLEAARVRGFTRVVLDTDRDQLRAAYELYLKLEFTECASYGEVDYATPTFMEKLL